VLNVCERRLLCLGSFFFWCAVAHLYQQLDHLWIPYGSSAAPPVCLGTWGLSAAVCLNHFTPSRQHRSKCPRPPPFKDPFPRNMQKVKERQRRTMDGSGRVKRLLGTWLHCYTLKLYDFNKKTELWSKRRAPRPIWPKPHYLGVLVSGLEKLNFRRFWSDRYV